MRNLYIILFIVLFGSLYSCRKSDDLLPKNGEVINDQGSGIGTTVWTKDMDITLEGFVFVNEGQVLTINPGTVIKFKEGQGATASALIIARGGKIIAEGTKEEPIIFTSELDDLSGNSLSDTSGLWGGLIVLGNGLLNTTNHEAFIEGIPISEPRGLYGGMDNEDNSGILKYVSIRYAGTFLHEGNEINGLTLGGVGNKTTIEYVEVVNSADDGVEVFGGAVNLKNIIAYNAHDDAFDYDLGYQGKVQFFLGIQNGIIAGNLIEGSGAIAPTTNLPISMPILANFTFIGDNTDTETNCVNMDRSAAGKIYNSILLNKDLGAIIEYTDGLTDCYSQYQRENLKIESNLFYNVAGNESSNIFNLSGPSPDEQAELLWSQYFDLGKNKIQDVGIGINQGILSLFPNEPTDSQLYDLTEFELEVTNYKGAFGTFDWSADWTIYQSLIAN